MFDGNGNWKSDFSAQADRDNGIKILASRFDNIFIADIKESFENCLTKDGQISPIRNFNMGGQKITNLNNGVNDNDAVNKSQIDNIQDNLQAKIGTKANTSDVVNLTGTQTISGQKTFSSVAYGKSSDAINSILTTVLINKSANGHFKLGNGLIIQWGRSNQRTFTYPIPFSSDTSFSIVVNNQAGTDGYGRPDSVDSLTRTSCMVTSLAEYPVRWIAIGY